MTETDEVVDAGEVRLRCRVAGPRDGEMVLLLHGFPERAHTWRRQIGPLAERGYLVVAPDQRGYAGSDRPDRVADYAMDHLVRDALGVIDAFGRERAHVVGHDWGGSVAWHVLLDHAERAITGTVLNIPHPSVMARHLRRPPQLFRSWYALAFQVPELPEWFLSRRDHAFLVRSMRKASPTLTEDDLAIYREGWRTPGALRAMLNWYRAAARTPRRPTHRRVTVPMAIVWGKRDPALGFELVAPSAERCDDVRVEVVPEAGHFVHHDAADLVNRVLAEHLAGRAARPSV